MNFKTTTVLLVLLIAAGVAVYFTRSSGNSNNGQTTANATPAKLFDFSVGDVDQFTIVPAGEKPIAMKRTGFDWRITSPIKGPADSTAVNEILSDLSSLTSSGTAPTGGANASAVGLSPPQFNLTLDLKDGKTIKLAVGNRTGMGGQLYVQKDARLEADLVQADVYDLLDKPMSAFRRAKLLEVSTPTIDTLTIARQGKPEMVLHKKPLAASSLKAAGAAEPTAEATGGNWTIEKPTTMPADNTAVSDLLMGLSNLQATKFVADTDPDPHRYGLQPPAVRVSFGTTQPSTTVDFGMLDVLKQNAYASTSDSPGVVQVAASTLDTFDKSPLDLRDKNVLSIDPATIASIRIETESAATTRPSTRPATPTTISTTIALLRRSASQPSSTRPTAAPTSQAATQAASQAASQPTSQATGPLSKWVATVDGKQQPASDSKIETLLSNLHPLKVQKYLETSTTQPSNATRYTIELRSAPPMVGDYKMEITDLATSAGNSQPPIGRYNGLTFELDRTTLDAIKADFLKSDEPPSAKAFPGSSAPESGAPEKGAPGSPAIDGELPAGGSAPR